MLVRLHFPRVAPCTGAGMVTPMPVTRRLWAPITFVTIALAACKGTEPFVPVATTLHVAPSSLSFTSLGATRQVVAVVLDQRADTIKHPSVVWSSDNSGVATVSAFGLVTAVGNGSAHAVATTGGLSAQVTVSVAQTAAQLIKAGGDGQTGVVRATLPSALALEVVDAGNRPMTGVTVTFTVTLGGGSLSNPSGPTDGSGLTTIQWTLGTTPGQQQLVQASLAGTSVSPATFSATATAGPPASATKLVGDNQTAATNNPVPTPPSVQVSDSYGGPRAGSHGYLRSHRGRRDRLGRRDPNRRERCGDGRTLDARCRRGTEYADRDRGGLRHHRQPGHVYGHRGAAGCARQRVGGPRRRPDGAHGVRPQHRAGRRGAGRGELPRPQRGGHLRGVERRGERHGRECDDRSRRCGHRGQLDRPARHEHAHRHGERQRHHGEPGHPGRDRRERCVSYRRPLPYRGHPRPAGSVRQCRGAMGAAHIRRRAGWVCQLPGGHVWPGYARDQRDHRRHHHLRPARFDRRSREYPRPGWSVYPPRSRFSAGCRRDALRHGRCRWPPRGW